MSTQDDTPVSITNLRDTFYNLHQSDTSTVIQEYKYFKASPQKIVAYATLALRVLTTTIMEAAYMFVHTNGKLTREKQAKLDASESAFAFLSGTGLNLMMETYSIGYDADDIRDEFYRKFHVHES